MRSLAYYGGKSPLGLVNKFVNEHLPSDGKGVHYIEPFAGAGGILLSRPPCEVETLNDRDRLIVNWWECVRSKTDELQCNLELTPYSKEAFRLAKNRLLELIDSDDVDKFNIPDVEVARDYQVIVWQSIMHGSNVKAASWAASRGTRMQSESNVAYFESIASRLKNVQLENTCALKLLDRMADEPGALIYCDPPYPTTEIGPYRSTIDFDKLAGLFQAQKGRVAISGVVGDWDELIETPGARGPWRVVETEIRTTAGMNTENKARRRECLYMNYDDNKQTTLL